MSISQTSISYTMRLAKQLQRMCTFKLDNEDHAFYCGDIVTGTIDLKTEQKLKVKEIYTLLHGEAKVHWIDTTKHYPTIFSANEEYVHVKTVIFEKGILPIGFHTYDFSLQLPFDCPPTCVGEFGQISYELSLVIDENDIVETFKRPIKLIRQLDLNKYLSLSIPVIHENIGSFCCFPCSSGPVIITVTLPAGAFTAGQLIPYTISVDNQSKRFDLEHPMRIRFIQIHQFTALYPRKRSRHTVTTLARSIQFDKCPQGTRHRAEGSLVIPHTVPASMLDNSIITIKYQIILAMESGKCGAFRSKIMIPILIGTVPFLKHA